MGGRGSRVELVMVRMNTQEISNGYYPCSVCRKELEAILSNVKNGFIKR